MRSLGDGHYAAHDGSDGSTATSNLGSAISRGESLSFQLAQARYRLGLSAIVELSQAQLQQTSAEIDNTNARYQYGVALATLIYEEGR